MPDIIRPLDATDVTQIIVAVQEWINSLQDPVSHNSILPSRLWLEFPNDPNGYGYSIKSDGGSVLEEDITSSFSAEIPFLVYYKTNAVPDGAGDIYKPLNDLSAWFRKNGTAGLNIGERRTPDTLITLRGPMDQSGKDEDGNVTFFSAFALTYDEEVYTNA
jgi:hypothetical protein